MVGEIKGGGKEGGNWVNIKIDKWLMVDMYGQKGQKRAGQIEKCLKDGWMR